MMGMERGRRRGLRSRWACVGRSGYGCRLGLCALLTLELFVENLGFTILFGLVPYNVMTCLECLDGVFCLEGYLLGKGEFS